MAYTTLELLGTIFFAIAVVHTFMVGKILHWSHQFPKNSMIAGFLHLLGEIEAVFAIWASLFMVCYIAMEGWTPAITYQNSLDFTEPFFIFAIMVICSTRPIITVARQSILAISSGVQKVFKTPAVTTDLAVVLILGPLSGSFITEPAAMTVTAFMLNAMLQKETNKLIYALIAVLFVNVSIGGALTPFAAPPILMVASKWGWDFAFVATHLGWKAAIAVIINAIGLILIFRKDLQKGCITLREVETRMSGAQAAIPWQVILIHLLFLAGIVVTGHHRNAFLGIFLLFLGVASVTIRYQDSLRLKESLLVSLFLGGIIQFGAFQKWWLAPLLSKMNDAVLFKGATLLTAITDNAALTYLGSQVDLSDSSKYALVAGALAGGGLTIIANAPNAAGYSVLSHKFPGGIKPLNLLIAALAPTAIAIICLWLL
ncbi:putative Na+/H+ antiporter [Bdellovibrio sp. SKB1291214]|uniref:putative Na+/H+ antiporter n=1 Tax=Bdellovibrio sp. SKB1291214 TaxID=1732569 RepID=UPI000B516330|nr:putative Na+/H+ antiporter [Bdellovibrio sp. SKB1291214]UYL09497.1 putative Na+/H+ antiporter [Bdellovibrio sp. SKB1291214]